MDQETAETLLREAVSGEAPKPARPPVRRSRPILWGLVGLVVLLGVGVGLAVLRLSHGPLRIEGMSARVAAAIADSIGPGWRVALRDSSLELDADSSLALRVAGLDVFNPDGDLVVRAPLAVVSLDPWRLVRLSVQPRSIEFRDLQMTALVNTDGSIAFAASSKAEPSASKPHTLPSVESTRGAVSLVSAAAASILGVVLDRAGVIGAIDRARLTNARLTLVDDEARVRAVFDQVNGLFRRDALRASRVFELRIDGPHGEWRFGGDVREEADGRRAGTITLDDLPITDLMLLSGQSRLPVETDLKLSAKVALSLQAGRLQNLEAEIRTGGGSLLIEEKDFNPVSIDSLDARVAWDEGRRGLDLRALDYRGGGNTASLSGTWNPAPADGETAWTFDFGGRDAVLRGAAAADAPVRIDTIKGRLAGRDGGVAIDAFALEGEGVRGTIAGTVGTRSDADGLTLRIAATGTEGRTALRLWPEHIAPTVRNYLVDDLRGGQVDTMDIRVDMSGPELAAATKGDPVPDHAVDIDFALSGAGLTVSQDAPPLSRGRVAGRITGRTTTIQGAAAEIRMPDNRALALSDGAFLIRAPSSEAVVAQIGLRLSGGADALASLLQAKMFKGLTGADFDPAAVRGQADLRLDFPLDLKSVPDLEHLPVTLGGTLTDLSLDKAIGKDRFEGGRLALTYDRSGFAMKGEGRVLGTPVSLDLKQPRPGAPGELVVTLAVDEALRARRGLPVAPQLSGSIPTRVVVPVGRAGPGKPPIRIEADLARAAIDGVLPGWSKPAGKPGRLAFTLVEGGGGALDLRDISLDAAPALARGGATFSAEGGIERAELSTLRLSPGDDMRVSLDRSGGGYKVSVRGGVADARPFLRSLTGPETKGAKDGAGKEVDADVNLNILTGHNGEALTGASLRLTMKGGDVRTAQFRGKFGAAPFSATVSRSDRGAPLLALETSDSGATLRFLDIYKRMYGGRMGLSLYLNDGPQSGVVQIRDFTLRNEPALSSIVAQGPAGGEAVDARGRKVMVQPRANDVAFDRLRANFSRNGTRVSFSDAAISNAAMGFTLGGWLDTAKERTQIDGTFVPLYGLNNVVAQVPLLGPLLAGGQNEGLFAVNFNVSGPIAKPTVNVNPLSAVAPGFLRKLFGAGGPDDEAAAAAAAVPVR